MLELINSLAHGFVAVPLIDSCRRGGVIAALANKEALPVANQGHLRVALRLLESLQWLNSKGELTEIGQFAFQIPDVRSLYRDKIGFDSPWLKRVQDRWPGLAPELHSLMDGAVLTPVLAACSKETRELHPLFHSLDWMSQGQFTDLGTYLMERAMILGTTASYRPMLAQCDELLFGQASKVFQRGENGHESHLDRSLNVRASGFQHERYFRDLKRSLESIFSAPMEEQPQAICDMGCGDGTFLKTIHAMVADLGRDLKNHPLMLVAADYNREALSVAAETLEGLPFTLIQADIGEPAELIEALRTAGIEPSKTLHVRSFLDHNRPYRKPEKPGAPASGVFVGPEGERIEPEEAVQSLVEHLERWSQVVEGQGLLVLEVHSLPARQVSRHLEQTENLHFDAYHALSGQFLVEAHTFLKAAALSGLFPRREFARRYPNSLPVTRITLSWLQKREYRLCPLKPEHLGRLQEIEASVVEAHLRTPPEELLRRIQEWPDHQLGLLMGDRLVGAVYSQAVKNLDGIRFENQGEWAHQEGDKVQLLGLHVLPEWSGLGDSLLDFALQYLAVMPGVTEILGLTRCRDAELHGVATSAELEAYLGRDPIVKFHQSHGAEVLGLRESYRPEDKANLGCGILLSYDPKVLLGKKTRHPVGSRDVGGIVASLLEPGQHFEATLPLRELGLDSLALMELKTLLEGAFETSLEPGFFFRYRSAQEIANFFEQGPQAPRSSEMVESLELPPLEEKDEVAIVGLGCRYPGVRNPEEFWQKVIDAESTTGPSPRAFPSLAPASFLESVDEFDEGFFQIAPREAALMDPQHRCLLEVSWEALEQAGIPPHSLKDQAVGTYLGLFSHDYESLHQELRSKVDGHTSLATASSAAAGRLAYYYGWRGPAMVVHTACSSSLVAVHLARKAILDSDCEMALAGGVNLMLSPHLSEIFTQAGMLSPDGLCKAFDARGDGYGRGEGCGLVVLKRLSAARRDGNRVLAVLKSSVVNQDGASNGITAPSPQAQEELHRAALSAAGAQARDLVYLEAHGTGTSLGDPVEMEAVQKVHGFEQREDPLWVGSVKGNFGHTEAAAGVTGLIKAVLMLGKGRIPPQASFSQASPQIHWQGAPVRVSSQARDLPEGLLAVSSFGFSGTNCQVLLGAPLKQASRSLSPPYLVTASAKCAESLLALAQAYQKSLPGSDLPTFATTSTAGRSHHPWRLALLGESKEELASQLQAQLARFPDELQKTSTPSVVFLFTGQGSQYAGMGEELYRQEPVFRAKLDHLAQIAESYLDRPLLELLFGKSRDLDNTTYTQAAVYCYGVALAALWGSWGVSPSALMGHSVGEYAAAHLAGVFSLEDGLKLVAARGRLMGALPPGGGMASVLAGGERVRAHLAEGVEIACFNGPEHLVLAGEAGALDKTLAALEEQGVQSRPLVVSHAFHSPLMEPMLESFSQVLETVDFQPPRIALYSNLTGKQEKELGKDYWLRHARAPVCFEQGLRTALGQGHRLFLELGASPHLSGMARRMDRDKEAVWLASCEGKGSRRDLLSAVKELYLAGCSLHFQCLQPGPLGDLPTYPWRANKHWLQRESSLLGEPLEVAAGPSRYRQATIDDTTPLSPLHWLEAACQAAACDELQRIYFPNPIHPVSSTQVQWVITGTDLQAFARNLQGEWICHFQAQAAGQTSLEKCGLEKSQADLPESNSWLSVGRYRRRAGCSPRRVQARDGHFYLLGEGEEIVASAEGILLAQAPSWTPWLYRLQWAQAEAPRACGLARPWDFESQDLNQAESELAALESLALGFLKACLPVVVEDKQRKRYSQLQSYLGRSVTDSPEPRDGAEKQLLQRCGPWLKEVLLGKKNPLDLLLPGGDMEALVRFYESTPTFTSVNQDLARLLTRLATRSLRILEVGAGTGATTRAILKAFQGQALDYTFTDISSGFFGRAPEGVLCRVLDIEKDPEQQGFREADYDIVVAANVLHATAQLQEVLIRLRRLLAPGGALVFLEGVERRLWVDLTFGLTDGWWRCEDRDYPLLNVEQWTDRLSSAGFEESRFFRAPGQAFFPQVIGCAFAPLPVRDIVRNRQDIGGELSQEVLVLPEREPAQLILDLLQSTSSRLWVGVHPGTSELLGLCRSMALERPERLGGILFSPEEQPEEQSLLSWMNGAGTKEMSWLKGGWRRPVLERMSLTSPPFHIQGGCLITGGLRGLGLALARRLSRRGVGRLHLLSRGAHPEAAEALAEMRERGTLVTTYQIDVSDEQAMTELLRSLSPLTAVFHSAGILDDASLLEMSPGQMQRVLDTKLEGARILARETVDWNLKHFVLFSSSSAVLGSPGQSNHAAACSALDGLALELNKQGRPALSINWGAWSEIGTAAEDSVANFMQARGLRGMAPESALDALEALLAAGVDGQVMVADIDWAVWESRFSSTVTLRKATEAVSSAPSPPPLSEQSSLEDMISVETAKVLGIKSPILVPRDVGFFDLGLDSLTSLELRNRLQDILGKKLATTVCFDFPTVERLADFLREGTEFEELRLVSVESEIEDMGQDELCKALQQELDLIGL